MPMTKQERDELRAALEGWEDLPIQTGFGNTVCTASQLRELLDGAERLVVDVAPILEDFASDPAVAEVGHSIQSELRLRVQMHNPSDKEARHRLYEKHRVWLLKMPGVVALDLALTEIEFPLPQGEPEG